MVDITSIVGMILLGVIGIALVIFVLAGIVYVSRYQVGIKTKKMFGKKMPQGQIIARGRNRYSGRYTYARAVLV